MITYDEAAFERRPEVFKEGLFPVMMQRRAVMFLITTPGPPESYFMRLLQVTDEHGQPKMRLIRLGQSCDECAKGSTPWACQHMRNIVPKWKSKKKELESAWLFLGDVGTLAQENNAAIQDLSRFALGEADNLYMRNHTPIQSLYPPQCIAIGMDAALGGDNEYAIIATYKEGAGKHAVSIVIV